MSALKHPRFHIRKKEKELRVSFRVCRSNSVVVYIGQPFTAFLLDFTLAGREKADVKQDTILSRCEKLCQSGGCSACETTPYVAAQESALAPLSARRPTWKSETAAESRNLRKAKTSRFALSLQTAARPHSLCLPFHGPKGKETGCSLESPPDTSSTTAMRHW